MQSLCDYVATPILRLLEHATVQHRRTSRRPLRAARRDAITGRFWVAGAAAWRSSPELERQDNVLIEPSGRPKVADFGLILEARRHAADELGDLRVDEVATLGRGRDRADFIENKQALGLAVIEFGE